MAWSIGDSVPELYKGIFEAEDVRTIKLSKSLDCLPYVLCAGAEHPAHGTRELAELGSYLPHQNRLRMTLMHGTFTRGHDYKGHPDSSPLSPLPKL